LIVGAGTMGTAHALAARELGDEVVAVVDPDPDVCSRLASRFGARTFATVADAIAASPIDAAAIASPSGLHLAQSVELVTAGVAVLVEKPHRLPGEDPEPLRQALASGRSRYQVGMSTRYLPGMAALAGAVHAGALGTLAFCSDSIWFQLADDSLPRWYFSREESGGGVLLTNGVHALDRLRWLIGGDLELEDAVLADLAGRGDCETSAQLRLRGPADATLTVSLLWSPWPLPPSALVVVGTEGSGVLRGDGSHSLSTASHEAHGGATAVDDSYARQWRDFRGEGLGPGLEELEPTLRLIERVYGAQRAAR
jgi:predicted dehydrogenase